MEETFAQFGEITDFLDKFDTTNLPSMEQLEIMTAQLELVRAINEYVERVKPIIIEHLYDEEAPKGSSFLFKM